ncbi:Uncharacterised protein [Serratia entomophila]|nr:Uncharacterised protein [Serratia entomophila]CAI1562641.1 Uncharacterised protein [Serratia entomophila]
MPDPLAENIIALYEKHAGAWAQLRSTSLYSAGTHNLALH